MIPHYKALNSEWRHQDIDNSTRYLIVLPNYVKQVKYYNIVASTVRKMIRFMRMELSMSGHGFVYREIPFSINKQQIIPKHERYLP